MIKKPTSTGPKAPGKPKGKLAGAIKAPGDIKSLLKPGMASRLKGSKGC